MAWNQPGKGKPRPLEWQGIRQRTRQSAPAVARYVRWWRRWRAGGGGNPLGWALPLLGLLVVFNSFKLVDERAARRGAALRQVRADHDAGRQLQVAVADRDASSWSTPPRSSRSSDQVRVLTRDENIVDIKFNAQYQVSDPRLFLFGFRDDCATARFRKAARHCRTPPRAPCAKSSATTPWTPCCSSAAALVVAARQHLQESLDIYKTGLKVTEFNLPERASAGRGQDGVRRRHQRPRGQEPHRERGQGLRQQDRARSPRRRAAHQGRVGRLSRRHHRQGRG